MKRVHSGLDAKYVTCSNCGVEVKGIRKHEKICKKTDEEKAVCRENLKVECQNLPKILADKNKLAIYLYQGKAFCVHVL